VLQIPPTAAAEELKMFRETLYTERAEMPEELSKLVKGMEQVITLLDGFSSRVASMFTLYPSITVPPHSIPQAFRTYTTTALLATLQLLDQLETGVKAIGLDRASWSSLPLEEKLKLAEKVKWYEALAKVVMTGIVKNSQVLVNILGRSIPDARQRSAPTVETLGRMVMSGW